VKPGIYPGNAVQSGRKGPRLRFDDVAAPPQPGRGRGRHVRTARW
jgi:hypothetical protein